MRSSFALVFAFAASALIHKAALAQTAPVATGQAVCAPRAICRVLSAPAPSSAPDSQARGVDLVFREGEPQWILGKFAYGRLDRDLKNARIEILKYVDCARWEPFGSAVTTTNDTNHPPVEGVDDRGGRIYFSIPPAQRLGVGWHHFRLLRRDDGATAEINVFVAPATTKFVVSDIDGTLTTSESEEIYAVLQGRHSNVRPGAARMLRAFAEAGFVVLYISARPEWLMEKTREWLSMNGFPPGLLRLSTSSVGIEGAEAAAFKIGVMRSLVSRFPNSIQWAFGNKPSDVQAYREVGVPTNQAFFFELPSARRQSHSDYRRLFTRIRTRILRQPCP